MRISYWSSDVCSSDRPMLTKGVAHLIAQFCSADQKQRFLQPLHDGRFFGTMCLSEPQAGPSLGDISTRAEPIGNGDYRITGAKMWISGGDYELAGNIVHMVLARTPAASSSEDGRLGTKRVCTCSSWWTQYHYKKNYLISLKH